MKNLLPLVFVAFVFCSWGQNDTIYVDNFVECNQDYLSELSPSIYDSCLINRSSLSIPTLNQLTGKDSLPHNLTDWMYLYSDIYYAHFDSTKMLSVRDLYALMSKRSFDYRYPDTSQNIRPLPEEFVNSSFGLIIQEVTKLKDSAELINLIDATDNNKLLPLGDESNLYEKITLKSASSMEFYNPQGYNQGRLHFENDFIVTSPNIEVVEVRIGIEGDYFLLDNNIGFVEFSFDSDTTYALAAVTYLKDGIEKKDTIEFILMTQPSLPRTKNNPFCVSPTLYDNTDFYDFHFSYSQPFTSLQFDVGVISGCGNNSEVETVPPPFDNFPNVDANHPVNNIKRPIILLPPYRPNKPTEQKVSMGFYYCKYNIDGFIDEMVAKGYDIIIIKESPGDQKISTAGKLLADFITDINSIKGHNFPNESWENIVFGFSAGGQHARYGLKVLEKRHMEWGTPHPHTRLYAPVDSPHNGANVPIGTQAAFWEYARTLNPIAVGVLLALNDDASKGMLSHHISSNLIGPIGPGAFLVEQTPTFERTQLMDELQNDYNHQYTKTDGRKTFPSFSRNIAVSMGRFDEDYDQEYGLGSRKLLFRQIVPALWVPGFGFRFYNNALFASPMSNQNDPETIFRRMEIRGVGLLNPVPAVITRFYTTNNSPGFDQSRGGHKNVFYDGLDEPWAAQFVGAVQVLRSSAFGLGVKHYEENVNFMPLTSAFAVKDGNTASVLQNFNPQGEDMMFQSESALSLNEPSSHFGYPHLGRPNDHFSITPFEAIYADNQTYEHIDVINTVDPSKVSYLDSIRVFLRDEIEGENFYLQNKTIGKNHVNWLPHFEYKAWYKADKELYIGHEVTPKTNKGDYIIEKTGNITVYAGDSVIIKPGFHTKAGSTFHAFINPPECEPSAKSEVSSNNNDAAKPSKNKRNENKLKTGKENISKKVRVYPNPNSGSFTLEVADIYIEGEFMIFDTYGKKLYLETIKQNTTRINKQLEKGVYFAAIIKGNTKHVEKIIVQ